MSWFPTFLRRVPPLPAAPAPVAQPVCIHCQGQLTIEKTDFDDGAPDFYRARCQRCDAAGPLVSYAVDAMPAMSATSLSQLRDLDPDNWPGGL